MGEQPSAIKEPNTSKQFINQDAELSQILSQDSKLLDIDNSVDFNLDIKKASNQHQMPPSERVLNEPEQVKANQQAILEVLEQNSDSKTQMDRQASNP